MESVQHLNDTSVLPKRVVILGGSGFVGKTLGQLLAQSKIEVLSFSSKECNLLDPEVGKNLKDHLRPDDTVVFASAITPDKGKDETAYMNNVRMAYHLCPLFGEKKFSHLIYVSSDAVYGDESNPIRESTPPTAPSLYGLAHRSREMMLQGAVAKSGTPYLVVRPCAIYGKEDTHNSYGPNRFFRTAKKDGTITLFGGGEEKRDHLFIGDLCELLKLCLARRTTGVLNACSGVGTSFFDVASQIAKRLGDSVKIESGNRNSTVIHRHFDPMLLRKSFPLLQVTALSNGIDDYFS